MNAFFVLSGYKILVNMEPIQGNRDRREPILLTGSRGLPFVVRSPNLGLKQPRSQALSSLSPLFVGRKTLVAAGHVTTCDTINQ